jgi:hypothetical protein
MYKLLIVLLVAASQGVGASLPAMNLRNLKNENVVLDWQQKDKVTAIIFLSAMCPCSHDHLSYLNELKKDNPQIEFFGIHSNADEDLETVHNYFSKNPLAFTLLKDNKSIWANILKAYRTPHAYLISPEGKIIYQGGVTNSTELRNATEFFLANAIKDISTKSKIKKPRTRVLGCPIARD